MIKKYLNNIAKTTAHQDQREESYYPAVATFMTEFANSINKKKVSVTVLPKKTEAGNPDFRVWDGDKAFFKGIAPLLLKKITLY